MVAALLYLIGLIAVLVSIAIVGFSVPEVISRFTAAMDAGNANLIDLIGSIGAGYSWALGPVVGGLVLMGFARVIMLLSSINRSLRGQG